MYLSNYTINLYLFPFIFINIIIHNTTRSKIMKFDGIEILEGGVVKNLTVKSDSSYPASPELGELFYKIGEGLALYDGTDWSIITVVGQEMTTGDLIIEGEIHGPANFVIDPAAVGDNTGVVVIRGDLQVDGTTTTINSTTLTVTDKNIVLSSGAVNSAAADGAGITISGANATLTYASSGDNFVFNKALELNANPTTNLGAATKQYVDTSTSTHAADETKHLTSAQNTWIDSITATAIEVNYLTGTTSSVQTQLGSKLNLTGGTLSGNLRVNAQILSLNSLTVNTGDHNIAFGESALRYNTTGTQNTAVGKWSLQNTTTGGYNVAVGASAAIANTTGQLNTAIGGNALYNNLTGSGNTAIGNSALFSSTGSNNIAVGYNALYSNTASGNLAVGNSALYYNTTGTQNVAIGTNGGLFNSGGIANTFIGLNSGMYNTVGYYNTALGNQAGYINATGYYNTSIGFNAGNTATTTGGTTYSSVTVTSGVSNNNLGLTSGGLIQVQAQTTNGGFVSGSWYIFWHNGTNVVQYGGTLSGTTDFITNGAMNWSNTSSIGNNSQVSGNHQVQLGDASTTTYVYGTVQNRSDERDKADIRDTVLGLDFINALRPVDYRWDLREDYVERITEEVEVDGVSVVNMQVINHTKDGSRKRNRYHHGVIAQEVKDVIDATGIDFGGYQDHTIAGGMDRMTIGYDELIAPLIKAVQELTTKNQELIARIEVLEQQ
jgi:hypothetical protein